MLGMASEAAAKNVISGEISSGANEIGRGECEIGGSGELRGSGKAEGLADFADLRGVAGGMVGEDGETFLGGDQAADGMLDFESTKIGLAGGDELNGAGAMLAEFFCGLGESGDAADGADRVRGDLLAGAVADDFRNFVLASGGRRAARSAALRDHDEHATFGGDNMFGTFEDGPAIWRGFAAGLLFGDTGEGGEKFVASAGEAGEEFGAILIVHMRKIACRVGRRQLWGNGGKQKFQV